jgi:predicted O-methyltransferase YrrM
VNPDVPARLRSLISYWLLQTDEYSIHSPYVFDLYVNCFKKALQRPVNTEFELLRKELKRNQSQVRTGILGSSVSQEKIKLEKIKEIAIKGITPAKYSLLMQEMIRYFNCRNIIELGTSLGINTMYLSKSNDGCRVYSFEGNPELAAIARKNFARMQVNNIELVDGNIDESLPSFIKKEIRPDFVFFDANHRVEPTLRYFNLLNSVRTDNTVYVLDDIHRSGEMEMAWNQIRSRNEVRVDMDLYQFGVILVRENLPKMSFVFSF